MDDSKLQMAHYCCESVLFIAHLDFAGSLTLFPVIGLRLIFNQPEVTWLWVHQMNNVGLVRVWQTSK